MWDTTGPAESAGWWPVALADDGRDGQPRALTLFDEPLVLWRHGTGPAVLQRDQCPHRGARLSLGRVCDDGTLQCPYHGWRFDGAGSCVSVPALPAFRPTAAMAVATLPLREAHGLLWTTIGNAATARLPDLPSTLPPRRLILGPFDVATSAPRAVENFLDTAHFATVHAGWLGDAAHPEVPHHEVTHTADGRPVVEGYRTWQPRATASAEAGGWVCYRYEVLSAYAALLTKQADGDGDGDGDGAGAVVGVQDSYTIWACPTSHETCRLWFAQYTTDRDSPDDALRTFQTTIFSQDQPVLESQRPRRLPVSGSAPREASTAADRLSAAYRRYLREAGVRVGVC
jgi:phenylpropionate dioxygenase-like ring-hydroxylating dioxygenase large terminal subunit